MKQVKLKNLEVVNFRGVRNLSIDFSEKETYIEGGNGTGKSTVYDAFLWLLFGKDAQDRKDFNIKRIENGEEVAKTDVVVSGILDIDGETVLLKRVFKENWVKPRGTTEQVLKGNETETYWNDVPVKVSEYQSRIDGIIDDTVFKMVTNPYFFVNMKWQEQREQLIRIAGSVSDAEIASRNPEYATLLDRISGKSLTDFKREVSARKKRLKADLEEIQPRIDQTRSLMPENVNFSEYEKILENTNTRIAEIDKIISDANAMTRQEYDVLRAKQAEISELKTKAAELIRNAQTAADKAVYDANEKRRDLEDKIKQIKRSIHASVEDEESADNQIKKAAKEIADIEVEAAKLRNEWFAENAREYKGDTACPYCGEPYKPEKIEEAKTSFAGTKAKKLDKITAAGKACIDRINTIKARISEYDADKAAAVKHAESQTMELRKLESELSAVPEANKKVVLPESLEGYSDIMKKIETLESAVKTGVKQAGISTHEDSKKELMKIRDEALAQLANRDLIKKYDSKIVELEEKGKELAQQIADAEREEYVIKQFNKEKIDESEGKINALFSMVKFKLFDYNIDDAKKENPIETCVPLVKGVPYGTANKAGALNAGLDIINALCSFYHVSAPIFIDNRESINEIINTDSQIINLVVTHDDRLTIKNS